MPRQTIAGIDELNEVARKANAMNTASGDNKKVLLQLNISERDKIAVKTFFAANNVSMTDGLIKCFYFVKNQMEQGKLELTRGGIFERRG